MTDIDEVSTDALTDRLTSILSFVDGHVRFAEGKNAALFAVNGATLFALLQASTSTTSIGLYLCIYLWVVGVGSALSATVTMLSFLPVTRIPWLSRPPKRRPTLNLLFFGDVERLNGQIYVGELAAAMGLPNAKQSALHRMYADQIVINGRIAARKFAHFRTALWITLFGFTTPLIGIAVLVWTTEKD